MNPKKSKRSLDGVLLLDKPSGISSNQALQRVKWLFSAAKAGHTGSLDPLATGMLPICFGRATKLSQILLNDDKTYQVVAQLGVRTTTSDLEGEVVVERPVPDYDHATLNAVLENFRGNIQQIPSMFSALKYQGQPLYKLARKGITIERPARSISIYQLNILSYQCQQLTLQVRCSKGTYIRTLVDDLGERLGCGAHVLKLRRISVNRFRQHQMHTLPVLQAAADASDIVALDNYLLSPDAIRSFLTA